MALKIDALDKVVNICMVGKYLPGTDSYLSVMKAIEHSSHKVGAKLHLTWVDASHLESKESEKHNESWSLIKAADGIIVPGGFGKRGIEGMILAIQYAREQKVPYLGVCLGLQLAVVEFTRNVLGLKESNSTEFDPDTKVPSIIFMPEGSRTHLGGTMRLGSRQTNL